MAAIAGATAGGGAAETLVGAGALGAPLALCAPGAPGAPGLSDEEIRAILAFIKSTWPERQRGYQAAISAQDAGP